MNNGNKVNKYKEKLNDQRKVQPNLGLNTFFSINFISRLEQFKDNDKPNSLVLPKLHRPQYCWCSRSLFFFLNIQLENSDHIESSHTNSNGLKTNPISRLIQLATINESVFTAFRSVCAAITFEYGRCPNDVYTAQECVHTETSKR